MNEAKKSFSGGLSYQGVISQGVIAPLAIHSNLKYKTCHTHIPTFHFFRFKLDETVTLTVHLTQLFYFQNISILFSANKSKHITSNLKSLKRHKLEGGGNLIFIFSGEFLYDGIRGMLIPLYKYKTASFKQKIEFIYFTRAKHNNNGLLATSTLHGSSCSK